MDLGKILLIAHVIGGFSSLSIGVLIMMLPKKGNALHKKLGQVYMYGMSTVFVTAVLYVSLIRWNAFLFAIAVFSFHMAYSGFRSIRLRARSKPAFADWFAGVTAIIVGLGIFGYGALLFSKSSSFSILALLCVIFGFFTVQGAYRDLKTKNSKDKSKHWWLSQHISGMMGSLIAATTAFSVQNLGFIIPGQSADWILWLLPTAIGVPILSYYISKTTGGKKKATQPSS